MVDSRFHSRSHSRSHFLLRLMKSFSLAFSFALVLSTVELAHAQPGEQRTPKQIRQQLKARLDELSGSVKEYPESVTSYIDRAETYAALDACGD